MRGLVESVFTEPVGSSVVADSTGTTVTVDEGAVFVGAAQVEIADAEYGLVSVDEDELTLDDSVSVEEGEQVFVFPYLPERLALVSVDDGETVSARVPHALSALLADGDRVDVDREVVVLASDDAGYFVSDVLTRNPQIEASLLVGELPPGMGTTPTDVEPAYSPVPVTRGGLGLILVSWEPVVNASPVVYDVYMGATDGFTADSSSLLQSTAASMVSVRALPDGTVLSYDTDYFFKLVARSGSLAAAEAGPVAGRMDQAGSPDIVAGSVTAEKLASTIVLAGEIATAPSGARVRLSAGQGLEGFGSAGDTVFHLPVVPDEDGNLIASVKADAVLRSATVEDRLSVRGQGNEFSKGSLVKLASGTTAPQVSPSASVQWPTNTALGRNANFPGTGFNPRSWFFDGSKWWSTRSAYSGWLNRYDLSGGSFVEDYDIFWSTYQYPLGGVAVLGGKTYSLVLDATRDLQWWVFKHDIATKSKEAEWKFSDYSANDPVIGLKGSNLLIAQVNSSTSKIDFKEYTTAGSLVGTVSSDVTTSNTGLRAVLYGSFDFGGDRYVVASHTWSEVRVFNSSGVRQTNDEFPVPAVGIDGLGWDSVNNYFMSTSVATVYRHTNQTWSGGLTRRQWVAHSWFDSNTGGTGQHETLISEPQSYTMNKRAAFTVTAPPLPAPDIINPADSVTGVRIYHGVGTTKPAASAMNRESTDLAAGVISKQYLALNATLPANTGTPTGFPASTPASIQSSDSPATIVLQGDGDATLNKVVSLKDKAGGKDFINSAGTGILQGTGELSPGRIKINSDNGASPTDVNPPFEIKSIATNQALRFDFNDIQARNGTNGNALSLNRFGGDITLGNSGSVVTVLGSFKDTATNTDWLNSAGTGRLQQPVILVADRSSTAYSIASGGSTDKFFNTTHHDITLNQGGFTRTSVSSVARYFVPSVGVYKVTFRQSYDANATGIRSLDVFFNGSSVAKFNQYAAPAGVWGGVTTAVVKVTNSTTDYLEFGLYQSSGGNRAMVAGPVGGQIVIERISD